ncbi:MAG: hypothetical protein JST76_14475 [Bacteroidetes bacterium]|nr:hypothetical protein [Bacteroidota bacterium]
MDAKRFFKRLLLFGIPFIFTLPVVEYGLSKIPNSYNTKRAYLEMQLDSIEVISTGTSHAVFSIDPQYISRHCFNLGNVGQSIYYDNALLQMYLPRMPHLKEVIIPISYFSLNYRLSDSPESWRAYFYARVFGIPVRIRHFMDFLDYTYLKMYYPETVKYTLKFCKVNLAPNLTHAGFLIKDTIFTGFLDTTGVRITTERALSGEHSIDHTECLSDLENMVATLRKKGIKVTFITTPAMKEYRDICDQRLWQQNYEEINALCRKYNCDYRNYLDDARFVPADFNDYSHTNYMGAAKFSKILDQEIVSEIDK